MNLRSIMLSERRQSQKLAFQLWLRRTDRWLSGVRKEESVTVGGFLVQIVVATRIYTCIKIHKTIYQKISFSV